jgi:hypothetical protein
MCSTSENVGQVMLYLFVGKLNHLLFLSGFLLFSTNFIIISRICQ